MKNVTTAVSTKNFITIKAKMYVEDSLDSDKIFDFWWLSGCAIEICHNNEHRKKITPHKIISRNSQYPFLFSIFFQYQSFQNQIKENYPYQCISKSL